MQFLHRAAKFTKNVHDLKKIYMLRIRSKLEQSAVVWHSSLTRRNTDDLERVQKSATWVQNCKTVLKRGPEMGYMAK